MTPKAYTSLLSVSLPEIVIIIIICLLSMIIEIDMEAPSGNKENNDAGNVLREFCYPSCNPESPG